MGIQYKTPAEIECMRAAGRVVALAHQAMREALRAGISTGELDALAEQVIRDNGAVPVFLNYPKRDAPNYPASINASINHELIHGIPSPKRVIREGDVVSLDTGCKLDGWVADAAWTYVVGQPPRAVQRLMDVGQRALEVGIAASVVGATMRDVANAVQQVVEGAGYSVARGYSGHGVGRTLHEEPDVPNAWPRRVPRGHRLENPTLRPGVTYAIEPMVIAGRGDTKELKDGWTVVAADGGLCVHFEHTIAVTEAGPVILTTL